MKDKAKQAREMKPYLRQFDRVVALTQYFTMFRSELDREMLISRNCERQGKASEGDEAVVTYGNLTES